MTPAAHVTELAVLGTRVRVDLADVPSRLAEQFHGAWRQCLVEQPDGAAEPPVVRARVFADPDGSVSDAAVRQSLMELTQQITRAAIEQQAGRALLFHAGGLAHPDTGASIVYVAPGGTGKTTLSRTLGPDLVYLTDETVAVVEDDLVLPYPKPLSVRRPPPHHQKDEVSPLSLGLTPAAGTFRPWVAGVVILAREASHDGVRTEVLDPLDAIARLAPETSSLGRLDRPLHCLAGLLERTGGARLVHYSEAAALREVVTEVTGRTR